MLALIAGTGALPGEICARLMRRGETPLVCVMRGVAPEVPATLPRLDFRIESFGSLLADLAARGVTRLCMAGAMTRPEVDPAAIDAATAPLVPELVAAMARGDDGTLRAFIAFFEGAGLSVVAAHEIAGDLLPPSGVLAGPVPDTALETAARLGEATVARMGAADIGQACVVDAGAVLATEGPAGTDAMLAGLAAPGAVLFKAPKPGQDRRADLPVIGPGTVAGAARAGLRAIVIEAGGVMVLDRDKVIAGCAAAGLTLWVREHGG
ncbi:LpxI family protein [Roseisalinus antarcticus]|uniref:UDP-2,3-diacylglucosamine pyrophosphatase LpxI n=1 Tax=Roseisalinus antarcticus TaxID=254357 RepID=A0A1Y5RG43_9RHOB|nr:UDP-2,3-diacylglucosamine diphosphatase LpxI [Roseisalinus antarcticus]SLN14073.1 hypothetical protein ROA7023_00111 [Roseisalinus antarcticus]